MSVNLLGLDGEGMRSYCEGVGERPYRAQQLLRGIHQAGADGFGVMTDISNWKKGEARMTAVTITMVDADHMKQTWTSETDGKSETFTMEFARKKS